MTRRLGRPPAEVSAGTRDRILAAARDLFARMGYTDTTNRHLADAANVTTGAIYHHFDSKLDLYRAVNDETQQQVWVRFDAAAASAPSMVAGIERVLDVADSLNVTEPGLARFIAAAHVDVLRCPELRDIVRPSPTRGEDFVTGVVERGVATGELAEGDRALAVALLRTVLLGLVYMSEDRQAHRDAVDGFTRLVRGDLIHPAAAASGVTA